MQAFFAAAAIAATLLLPSIAFAQAAIGQAAPAFHATTTNGKAVELSDYAGKYVVLEWFNPQCPFTQKHYNSGNMPATQQAALAKGAVWISINSDAPDASQNAAPAEFAKWLKSKGANPTAVVVDGKGTLGQAYGARATPHLFVINPQGLLIYAGAIDSKPSTNPQDIKTATNYVTQALDEALAGKAVSHPRSAAYGCGIHYAGAG